MMYNYGYMYSPSHFFGFLGGIVSFVFWVIVIVFFIRLLKHRKHMDGHWGGWLRGGSAMHTLRDRYAKGEISKEEYEERKKVLMEK